MLNANLTTLKIIKTQIKLTVKKELCSESWWLCLVVPLQIFSPRHLSTLTSLKGSRWIFPPNSSPHASRVEISRESPSPHLSWKYLYSPSTRLERKVWYNLGVRQTGVGILVLAPTNHGILHISLSFSSEDKVYNGLDAS